MRPTVCLWLLCAAALLSPAANAEAQIGYPSFQVPQTVDREFNFALSDAGLTTSLVFQWREGVGVRSQMAFDAGIADVSRGNDDVYLLVGGQYAYQMIKSTAETPVDMLFTAGVFTRLGEDPGNGLSVPFGISTGYRFPLQGTTAITPYLHPRVSVDVFGNDTELNINVDLGASFDVNSQLGLRFAVSLGQADGFGLSVAWRPQGLRR